MCSFRRYLVTSGLLWGLAATLLLLAMIIMSIPHGWVIELRFNDYNEGIPEVILITLLSVWMLGALGAWERFQDNKERL